MYICDVTEISLSNELVPMFTTLRVREKVHLLVTDTLYKYLYSEKNVCRLVKVLIKKGIPGVCYLLVTITLVIDC